MSPDALTQAFVYLAAAVVAVPLARRLGLGSVLGYLIAGLVIGPFGLRLVGSEGEDVMHAAEFGVVMMLFLIGLELEPKRLWQLRGPIFGMGGAQVLGTLAVVAALAVALGTPWRAALAVGMIVALSSTAIVLQTLAEKGLLKSEGGQRIFSVLLFQDIAVIPMLALFPLLATAAPAGGDDHGATLVGHLPAWAQTLAVLGAVGAVIVAGRVLVRPLLRTVARTGLRELFTAASLLLVVGIALLMSAVGLSAALGTFLAGVVLADSEYRHELESDLDPFKGLLLGLFFIAVGATIDVGLIADRPALIGGLLVGLLGVKAAILYAVGRGFGLARDQRWLFALALPQVGEFAFVLLSLAGQAGVLTDAVTGPLVATVALSMALTPLLFVVFERVVLPRLGTPAAAPPEPDAIDAHGEVLVAGYGDFGSTVGRLLSANGVAPVVLDLDADRVDFLRRLGLTVYYGDATRVDLLTMAGAADARLLVVALGSPEQTLALVETARAHFPHLRLYARAFEWQDAHDLIAAGADGVYRESLDTSLRVGRDVLHALGHRAYQAQRSAQAFRAHDEESLHALTAIRGTSEQTYVNLARRRIAELEERFRADRAAGRFDRDGGWDAEPLREDFAGRMAADTSAAAVPIAGETAAGAD